MTYTIKGGGTINDLMKKHPEIKLDIGCGYVKPNGFIGIDNLIGQSTQIPNEENAPDIIMDLNTQKFPFPDESVVEIRSSHFLEHSNLSHIFQESHRILVAGGIFLFAVPYANSAEGLYPGHNIFLTEKWFERNIEFQTLFRITHIHYTPSDYFRKSLICKFIPFSFARTFLFNACSEMIVTSVKI